MNVVMMVLMFFCIGSLQAVPRKIVILRHGEKTKPTTTEKLPMAQEQKLLLNPTGEKRAEALKQYLGKERTSFDVLAKSDQPAAIFAITMRTIQTIAPTADSWSIPVQAYVAFGEDHLNQATQRAAKEVMTNALYNDATVIMCWEHDHIAHKGTGLDNSLYGLLKLDTLKQVPTEWPGQTFDDIWVVEYDVKTAAPVRFSSVLQQFAGVFADLPTNAWGQPEKASAPATK